MRANTDIAGFLKFAADELAKLRATPSIPTLLNVEAAETFLREMAATIHQCKDGDGIALGGAACNCGLLDLAALVEARVRSILEANALLPSGCDCAIQYVTVLANDNNELAPFRVDGVANIKRSPRTVTITLHACGMTCRDLWHLAYTLHHELVCHAFQGALASRRPPNALPTCHWSEGWMDTVAFDLVLDWVNDETMPSQWLPLRGEDARGELWKFHDHRYAAPRNLREDDARRRRWARDAFRQLATTLSDHGMATSEEAKEIARRFALDANVHLEADCGLESLATKLRIALLSRARPADGLAAAAACLKFTVDHDFGKLEQALSPASN